MARYFLRPAVPVILAGLLAGCQDRSLGTLHGRVTLDGQPLTSGAIYLSPVDRNTRTASCMIENGEYKVELPATSYRVSISSPQSTGQATANPTVDDGPTVREQVPARYNDRSELTLTVTRGPNEKNFDLQSETK